MEYIKNYQNSTVKKQTIPFKNGKRTWTDNSLKNTWKDSQGHLPLGKWLKTTVKYHSISIRMSKIIKKNTDNS